MRLEQSWKKDKQVEEGKEKERTFPQTNTYNTTPKDQTSTSGPVYGRACENEENEHAFQ